MDNQPNKRADEVKTDKVPKPYSGYRDSVHDWLGAAPEHWKVVRSKYLFREVDDRTDTGTETLLSMRQAHGLIPHAKVSTKPVTPEDLKGYKRVQTGQMVLNRMQASNGMFAVAREDGLVSPDYAVFRLLQPIEPDYFVDLFKTNIYRAKFRQESKGLGTGMSGFLRLYSDRFGTIPVPQPPADEQRKIVDFIRSYDLRVRRLIRNKRRLIGLLNEQKLAIINQAVTRGLNPNAPMKPTGIDWMPEVPAHWKAKRLKYLTKFLNGIAFKPSDWKDTGVPIIRIENLNGSEIFNYTDRVDLPERMLIQPGDLVFAWSGNRGTSFGSFQWTRDFPAYLNQHIFKLEGYDLHRKYFFYLLRAVTKHVEDNAHGIIGLVHITKPALGALFVPLAPPEEQAAIADKIDEDAAELNQAIEKIVSEIRLIGEYRERLIADVVTGKLDVRHIEIAAPADEPAIDDADEIEEELETDDSDVMEGANGEE